MSIVRLLARPMIGATFVFRGVKQLRDPSEDAAKAKEFDERYGTSLRKVASVLPESPEALVRLSGGVRVGAGVALAMGRFPRLAATALAASMVPTTLVAHPFWREQDQAARAEQRAEFLKDLGLTGGLMLAAVDTDGKPGVSWRARRATRDARRSAVTARREARLASRAARAEVSARAHEAGSRARKLLPG